MIPAQEERRNKSTVELIILYVYAFFLFILNLIRIFDNNLWGDECFSVSMVKMPFSDMIATTASDVHPPLYYMFLRLIYWLFGCKTEGWIFHFASLIPYVFIIAFCLMPVRRRFGIAVSFWLMTFASLSPAALYYNIEVRMYSMAAMFVLFAYWSLLLIPGKNVSGSVLFVLFSLGAAYTHYYALIAVSFFYMALVIFCLQKKIPVKTTICIITCTVTGYVPWLLIMIKTFLRTSEDFWMSTIPTVKEFLLYYFDSDYESYSALMLGISCALIIWFGLIRRDHESGWILSGGVAAFGVLVLGLLISYLVIPSFSQRYLYPVLVVMWLVSGTCLNKLKHGQIIIAVLIILSLAVFVPSYIRTYTKDWHRNELCRKTDEQLNDLIGNNDVILTDNEHLAWTILDYYLPDTESVFLETIDSYREFDDDKTYWLIWSDELNDDEYMILDGEGVEATPVIRDGEVGLSTINLYLLETQ